MRTIDRRLEADGYQLGLSAYNWGYPLIRMERELRSYSDVSAGMPPVNEIGWARAPASTKGMPTANDDSFYMSAVVVLDGPFLLSIPDTGDSDLAIDVFNMWQELEHHIVGVRTTGAGTNYVLIPPGWNGEFARRPGWNGPFTPSLPTDAIRLEVSTNKVWLRGRLRFAQGQPVEPAHRLQSRLKLQSIGYSESTALPPLPSIADDDLGVFKQLAVALKSTAVKPSDAALFARFATMGLTQEGFDERKISPEMRRGILRGLADGPTVADSAFVSATSAPKGLKWVTSVVNFLCPLYQLVAGPDLGRNDERVARYPVRDTGSAPTVLNGKYVVTLDKERPGNGFWSLTTYKAEDDWSDDSNGCSKVGTDTRGLKKTADGSITIAVQNQPPPEARDVNWLPAPEGDFYVILQLYPPLIDFFDQSCRWVQIARVK